MLPEDLSLEQLHVLKGRLHKLPVELQKKTLDQLNELLKRRVSTQAQDDLIEFGMKTYPNFMVGPHHRRIAKVFEAIARGEKKRVIINIAPRFGKSVMSSILFPAWYMGKFPDKKIIMASHTADLAVDFGRKVRDMVSDPTYQRIFPGVELKVDSKAAGKWQTSKGGEYYAVGVGGALAGRGGDLIVIDDAHSEQEAKQGDPQVFLTAWEWFQSGPLQRLMPGGAIVVLMCMTGDTQVRMADGTEKRLDNIKIGDEVATYDDGKLTTTRVLNFQSSGIDDVFTLRTRSGIIIKANERHPFLVDFEGERQWIRVKDLKVGMSLVATRDAVDQQGHKQYRGYAHHAKHEKATIKNTPMPPTIQSATTENTEANHAPILDVINPLKLMAFALSIIRRTDGTVGYVRPLTVRRKDETTELKVGTESRKKILTGFYKVKAAYAQFVNNLHLNIIHARTGTISYALTTATSLEKSEGYCAMTVTSLLDTQKTQKPLSLSLNTSPFTLDQIVSITPSGREEVFDVEIERTENFIANGVVSHNTRWSTLDLTGQLTNHMTKNPEADQWEIIELPAILNIDTDDEKSLWPEFWPLEQLKAKQAGMDPRYWSGQYMQNPSSEGAALIKRTWWRNWTDPDPPDVAYIIMSLDAAQESHNRADYNALTIWGVFQRPNDDGGTTSNIILLDAWAKRMEFPELKRVMFEEYKKWEPDSCIIEKKSNGAALLQEMRAAGVPISEFTPGKGTDKMARVNAISALFEAGMVWAPLDRGFAKDVIEQCHNFPIGTHDDYVDSTTQAMMRYRRGGFITLPSDAEEDNLYRPRKTAAYY